MPSISLKIVQDEGAVTRKVKFHTDWTVKEALKVVKDKVIVPNKGQEYALFLRSADDNLSGVWLEDDRTLGYYMIKDGDSLDYICRTKNLRIRLLDGTLKTLPVDEVKTVGEAMMDICARIGIKNYDEYGLCKEEVEETEDGKEGKENKEQGGSGLTLKRAKPAKERDVVLEQMSKRLKTDDNVEWLDQHRSIREQGFDFKETLLLKRRLFYSDRNVDSRDPVQLHLLYVQTRDAILQGRHPVTEQQALVCKSRWINIRDMMRRKFRERLKNPNAHSYKYKYEEELSFMTPYFKEPISSGSTAEEYAGFLEDDACEVEMPSEVFVDEALDFEEPRETKPVFRKRQQDDGNSSREFSEAMFQELSPTDPLDVFLLTIGSTLRKFSPYYLNQAKSKIFQVVQDYELQQIVNKDGQAGSSDGTR